MRRPISIASRTCRHLQARGATEMVPHPSTRLEVRVTEVVAQVQVEVEVAAAVLPLVVLLAAPVDTVFQVEKVTSRAKRAVQQTRRAPSTPPRITDKTTAMEEWVRLPTLCSKPWTGWEVARHLA